MPIVLYTNPLNVYTLSEKDETELGSLSSHCFLLFVVLSGNSTTEGSVFEKKVTPLLPRPQMCNPRYIDLLDHSVLLVGNVSTVIFPRFQLTEYPKIHK